MQRKWRRAWLRGKPHYMRYKPVRTAPTGSIKAKVYDLTVKAAKKLAPVAAAAGIFLSSLTGVQASPTGGSITAGTGSITGQGTNHVTINQTSDKLAVNWNSFSIGSGEKVQFIQPGASSIALNRVLGNNASAIYGQLSANGKVFLLNPNGVLFAQGAQVSVGGLVASTLNLSDQDFMNGTYSFSGDSQQGVLNQGNITATNGGYVALLGKSAANEGVILAKEGTVALGAGSKITLDFTGDGLLTLSVDESKVKAEVKNSGLIKADGGLVVMNAKAADTLTGSVVNNTGTIEARSVTSKNGAIILTGDSVTNTGTLDASGKHAGETGGMVKVLGDTVRLAAGATIDVAGDQGGGTALVGGAYQGGASEYAATKTVVEQGTSINADALTDGNGGQVVVWANDTTSFAGGISAKGGKNGGNGGSVETSGKKTLTVADTASVNTTAANGKTGNWLLDPADFTVAASDGDITGTTVGGWLATNNVTIQTTDSGSSASGGSDTVTGALGTDGNIYINDTITWGSGTTLTLSAYNNISINRSITNTGAGSLALAYGQKAASSGNTSSYAINAPVNLTAGQHFSTKLGSDGTTKQFTVITSLGSQGSTTGTDLQGMGGNLTGNYFLGADIDASATRTWNGGQGFQPIGYASWNTFGGHFDGGGHTISGLTINRNNTPSFSSPPDYKIGLFGHTSTTADIRNVGLVGGSVTTAYGYVGGLVGENNGSITNSYNSNSVSGTSGPDVGGLVGYNYGSITNSYNSGSITGYQWVGGLVGNQSGGSIENSYNSGSVKGSYRIVGGLTGSSSGSITNSYNSGSVTGSDQVGGLVGYQSGASITNSYNSGNVTGSTQVGGLVGYQSGSITNSYNSGSVTGSDQVGGLVGYQSGGSVTNSFYAITDANGSINNGGSTAGKWSGNANGTGKALAELKSASFWTSGEGAAWSMDTVGGADTIWRIYDGHTTPLLKSFLKQTTVNADNASKTYDGTTSTTATNVTYSPGTKTDLLSGTPSYIGRDVGTYGLGGLYSGQQGYDIIYGPGTLTINKANLTLSGTRTYDASTAVAGSVLTAKGVNGETFAVTGEGDATNLSSKNVQTASALNSVTGLSLGTSTNGGLASNYNVLSTTGSSVTITPKTLTTALTGSVEKVYDGTNAATLTGGNYSALTGIISGEDVSLTIATSGSYADKNAGANKTVTVSGLSLSGAGAGNYQLASTSLSGNIGKIDKAALTITAAANTKTYDGTTTAAATPTYSGLQTGDSLTGLAEAYTDKNAGSGKTLQVSGGYTLTDGNNGGNYTVTLVENTSGKIDKAALTITAKNAEKIYDKLAYEGDNDVTFDGFVNGETGDVLNGSLTYGGTAQGATEIGTYTITPAGLTSTNYTISFRDGTLTIKPAAKPAAITDPGYIAAVQNRQQSTGNNTEGAGENQAYPPAANAASRQLPAGQASPIQYSSDTAGTPRVITTAGETVTIAQDSLLQLATNPVQKEIAVYQTINGSSALAGVYQVDGSQGSLTLRNSDTSFTPVSPAMSAPAAAQTETASFQLTDSRGNTANFTIAYTGGSLYIQGANATAADMLNQSQQLITATSLVAAQDKLGIDINNLQAVHLVK
ncbi:MAG: filamentous hemagglutinin N-terminal protein [Sporomusa sp.]|jgi:filamentous hemagglutinin family protein|nr:filamentous hemagglutinin N-terminal protein [Sporomusa sp.]